MLSLLAPARRAGRLLVALVLPVWLTLQVIGAPVRYLLDQWHVAALVYAPSALLAVAAGLLLVSERPHTRVVLARWFFALVAAAGCRASLTGLAWPQIAFGAWILLPWFAGLLAPPALLRRFGTLFGILFAIAAIGVFSETIFGPWAWQGHAAQIAGFSVESNRAWLQPGVVAGATWPRLAGFSRFSYATATQLLLLGIAWEAFGLGGRPRLMVRSAGFAASVLTTSKGVLLAWFAVIAGDAMRPWRRGLWRVAFVVPALIACVLPFASAILPAPSSVPSSGVASLIASLGDRMHAVWPAAIAATIDHGGLWIGRGLGSAGTAQWYFDRASYNPIDNGALFVFVQTGLAGLALLGAVVVKLALAVRGTTNTLRWSVRVVVATAVYAITTSVFESPEFSLFCAFAIGQLCGGRR